MSGGRPQIQIGEKTGIPLGWVLSGVAMLSAVVFYAGTKLQNVDDRLVVIERLLKINPLPQEHASR